MNAKTIQISQDTFDQLIELFEKRSPTDAVAASLLKQLLQKAKPSQVNTSQKKVSLTIPMSTVQLGIRIPKTLHEKLEAHAAKINASKRDVVISALATYLGTANDLPLSLRMLEVEKRLAAVETKVEKIS